ncbi:hypothetical protein [Pseudoalteromonas aurantia]|uniref:Uncharacterized protein n=1 Tax=Pseudoalteromonas aurantia TaxID=43654 RepID=A0A5S3V4V2_9GAMM|nr:hypothetical protein [Pseudoalteromonas aurantia]TMO58993.1 hypothetical protein CWC18_16670 [Pseudoalteromonas aurantia]TMO65918.1 hypothetical protein CWC19_16985 [Pseudoalteromonas aurantia]TMO78046.1 hypothetical protein CWC20_02550 [Pseudoalteromonas aurantia]
MKMMTKKPLMAVAMLLLSVSATSAIAAACSSNCAQWAAQKRSQICAAQNGGSACGSSVPLYNYLYHQCQQGNCNAS